MSNRSDGNAWRDSVLVALHEAGVHRARPLSPDTVSVMDVPGRSNLIEVPGTPWAVLPRSELAVRSKVSTVLTDAERAAQVMGKDYAAVVLPRRGRAPGQAYVVMCVDHFASLLRPVDQEAVA